MLKEDGLGLEKFFLNTKKEIVKQPGRVFEDILLVERVDGGRRSWLSLQEGVPRRKHLLPTRVHYGRVDVFSMHDPCQVLFHNKFLVSKNSINLWNFDPKD